MQTNIQTSRQTNTTDRHASRYVYFVKFCLAITDDRQEEETNIQLHTVKNKVEKAVT